MASPLIRSFINISLYKRAVATEANMSRKVYIFIGNLVDIYIIPKKNQQYTAHICRFQHAIKGRGIYIDIYITNQSR